MISRSHLSRFVMVFGIRLSQPVMGEGGVYHGMSADGSKNFYSIYFNNLFRSCFTKYCRINFDNNTIYPYFGNSCFRKSLNISISSKAHRSGLRAIICSRIRHFRFSKATTSFGTRIKLFFVYERARNMGDREDNNIENELYCLTLCKNIPL
jgi:hypothetical protein